MISYRFKHGMDFAAFRRNQLEVAKEYKRQANDLVIMAIQIEQALNKLEDSLEVIDDTAKQVNPTKSRSDVNE